MRALRFVPIVLLAASIGCGISKKEHDRLTKEALDQQKAAFDAEMKKMQEAHSSELASKQQRIENLEADMNKLGVDMKQSQSEMSNQLASAQQQLELLRKRQEEAEKEAATFRSMAEKLKSMIDAGKLQVVNRKGRMTLKLPDEILFPAGSKRLKKEGREALVSVIEVLKGVPDREFLIAGHTDNVPVGKASGFRSNWDLSTARAVEVVNLMVENGMTPQNVAAAGFGEFDPIGDNTTPEGRQQNRRLEIILMPKIEEIAAK